MQSHSAPRELSPESRGGPIQHSQMGSSCPAPLDLSKYRGHSHHAISLTASPRAVVSYSSPDPSDIKRPCLLPTPRPLQAHSSILQLPLSSSPRAKEQDIRAIPFSS